MESTCLHWLHLSRSVPAADPLHGQHRTLLGRGDHGAVGRGDVDAVAQAGGAMARVAGRGSGDRRALPL